MTAQYSQWRKASHSEANGHCVEVAHAADGTIRVRDTKAHGNGHIFELTRFERANLPHHLRSH